MNLVLGKLVGYAEANMELSRYDAAKLRFMLELILLNVIEFVLFTIFFAYIGRFFEFLVAMGVLMSVRLFSGGFHLKKYRYCFILSFAIFAAAILVLPDVSGMYWVMEGILFVTILLNIALAPVSKRNTAHSAKSNLKLKILSTVILLVYAFWLLSVRNNPYISPYVPIITWILFIQSTQLIIGKVMISHGKNGNSSTKRDE